MGGLGLACNLVGGRPHVVGVLAERDGAVIGSQVFQHLSDDKDDFPLQLATLETALESELPDIKAEAVVMRSLDWSRFSRAGMLQKRYGVEGIVLAVARRHVRSTASLDGREIGQRLGVTKSAAEAAAAAIFGTKLKEAGAAAMAALAMADATRGALP